MIVATTALPLSLLRRGKVRDVYEVDDERLLIVATDRVSAFDVVMREAVPFKGAVLTQLTAWWLRQLEGTLEHHMLSADADEIAREVPAVADARDLMRGRAMLCRRTEVYPIECVVRGYISGSAWKEYQQSGTLAGEPLAQGLRESDRLTPTIFSPATKAESGHDENITIARVREVLGVETAGRLEQLSRTIYDVGCRLAEPRGIIIADTKFELGFIDGELAVADEVLTPDSSRFWPADSWQPGATPPSFDKQPVRDYLTALVIDGAPWDKSPPPPPLSPAVIAATRARYVEAYERITGHRFDDWPGGS